MKLPCNTTSPSVDRVRPRESDRMRDRTSGLAGRFGAMLSSFRDEPHAVGRFPDSRIVRPTDATRLDGLSAQLLRRYTSRCAARAEARGEDRTVDREWSLQGDEVYCRAIQGGTLAKVRQGAIWVLFLEWDDGYGQRLLTRGSREHVERYALEVTIHGPPGGPEYRGQETGWRRLGDDDTLHALTVGGEFRLMPLTGGQHLLLFARNDFSILVLGLGEASELQRSADQRLQDFRGGVLRLGIGNEQIALRGVGAAGVIGYIDLIDGARLMLGHLAEEQFGLFFVRGETGECVGRYDLAAIRRGDLRRVLGWVEITDGVDGQRETDTERDTRVIDGASAPQKGCPSPPHPLCRANLSPAEVLLVEQHLTLETAVTGAGATLVPKILEGLRALARLGLPNQLLRACHVRAMLEAKTGVACIGCSKTFSRALSAVAVRTPLLRRVGKRWSLRFGDLLLVDSELMRTIAAGKPHALASSAPPAAMPGVADAEVPATSLGNGDMAPKIHAGISQLGSDSALSTDEPDATSYEVGSDTEFEGYRGQKSIFGRRLRRAGLLRATMASVPTEESASRRQPKRKGRGPP